MFILSGTPTRWPTSWSPRAVIFKSRNRVESSEELDGFTLPLCAHGSARRVYVLLKGGGPPLPGHLIFCSFRAVRSF